MTLACVLFGCDTGGTITLRPVLADGTEELLSEVVALWLTATTVSTDNDGGASAEARSSTATTLSELSIQDLQPGRWIFRIDAWDADHQLVLQGQTIPMEVVKGEETLVTLILAPPEGVASLPLIEGHDESALIASRWDLSATTVTDHSGRAMALIAGGRDQNDRKMSEAWIYRPDTLTIERVGPMSCPRSGHTAVVVSLENGRQAVLIAGGGDEACNAGAGRTTANSLELFIPETNTFRFFDPEWHYAPDLSRATLARLQGSKVLLIVEDEVWLLDVDRPGDFQQFGPLGALGAVRQAVTLGTGGRVAVVESQRGGAKVMIFQEDGHCNWEQGQMLDEVFDQDAAVSALTQSGRIFLIKNDQWWVIITNGCHVASSEVFRGVIRTPRIHPTATELQDERVLIVGGLEDGGETAILVPERLTPIGPVVHRGATALHTGTGHAVAALPDGTALIVGGGVGAELFNPARDQPEIVGTFDSEQQSVEGDFAQVVMVVDGTGEGERLRELMSTAVSAMLARPLGNEFVPATGTSVGVMSSDRGALRFRTDRCEPGPLPWTWSKCWSDPEETSGMVDAGTADIDTLLPCLVLDADRTASGDETGCPVRQPLAVMSAFMEQLAANRGELDFALGYDPGSLLFVLAVAGDDCSEAPDFRGPEIDFDPYTCNQADGLIDERELAEAILEFSRDNFRVEVVLLYGAAFEEFCALPERLGRFVAALGDQGHVFPACNDEEADDASLLVQNVARSLAYRETCLEPRATDPPHTCQVYVRWEDDDEIWLAPREVGVDWSYISHETLKCTTEEGEIQDALIISPRCSGAPEGLFRHFLYLCW
jgi:hypothetical protein